jgi:hypothetical protein
MISNRKEAISVKRWHRTSDTCFCLGVSRSHLLKLRKQGILVEGRHYRVLAANRIDYDIDEVEELLRKRSTCSRR